MGPHSEQSGWSDAAPSPDANGCLPRGCYRFFFVWALVFVLAAYVLDTWYVAIPGVLSAPVALYGVFELIQRMRMMFRWRLRGRGGLLVYSESPHWKRYIEATWLARMSGDFVVLNWSERKRWTYTGDQALFAWYCGRERNFNPAIILPRGLREPLVFRFFNAFRDAKHANLAALERLERRLFEELDWEYTGCSYLEFRNQEANRAPND